MRWNSLGGRGVMVVMLAAILIPFALASAAMPERTCAERVEGGSGGPGSHPTNVVTENVVFHGVRRYTNVTIKRYRGRDFTAKVGLSVRAGAPVVLRIAKRDRDSVALDYDMSRWRNREKRTVANGAGTARVRITPCAPGQEKFSDAGVVGDWTGFSGGFLVARRSCVTVIIERRGEAPLRRRLGFGRRCGTSSGR